MNGNDGFLNDVFDSVLGNLRSKLGSRVDLSKKAQVGRFGK